MKKEMAVLAGGCFWGMEDLVRKIPGVVSTDVGYSGGESSKPEYKDVKTGTTGHAEALKVEFDSEVLSFEVLLEHFFRLHDPTTVNRQGNDIGSQYRSVIFYMNDGQKECALKMIERIQRSEAWSRPLVTEVIAFKNFYPAEDFHQDYLEKNPNGYTCHYYRDLKF
jgi:methionine-S-sulfoxide reductase